MSLIVLAWKQAQGYPLILLANRDTRYDRPRSPLHIWQTRPVMYAGRDTTTGGTWLGIAENGRFAAITDFHHPNTPAREAGESQGKLLVNYLSGHADPETFLQQTAEVRAACRPHNLLLGDLDHLYYSCSRIHGYESLVPGSYVLGDYFINTPMPKGQYIETKLAEALEAGLDAERRDWLLEQLSYPMRFTHDLPSRGYPLSYEQSHSPVFLHTADFGTVASSLLTVDAAGQACFDEQSYDHGKPGERASYSFQLRKA